MNQPANELELLRAAAQDQFLEVIDRDTAMQRFLSPLRMQPLGEEIVPLADALGRILAEDVRADVDVPAFDRSNVDGFAVRAADTIGSADETPRRLRLNGEVLSPGIVAQRNVEPGTATIIATGGMVPRGADAVVMVEQTEVESRESRVEPLADSSLDPQSSILHLRVLRSVTAGQNITFAGTDIARGETVLRAGVRLTSREIGVLAAIGRAKVEVFRKPRVAILSTGDEIIAPGSVPRPGSVFDSNAPTLAAAVAELGCEPICLGIVPDDLSQVDAALQSALQHDAVLLSGGTSKGAGDLSYRVVGKLRDPGIVAHGVALKPGKPICLAVANGKPIVILPGFPTSALFTFHEFVAPVLRAFAGCAPEQRETVRATLPLRINSERGRTEFLLVSLVHSETGLAAYPMGKGSGSVTTFSQADGFITIGQLTEQIESGCEVDVTLLAHELAPADLVVIGSHCVGLDLLLSELQHRGVRTKSLYVGSTGGLTAAKRAECDIAGMHLLDAETGEYNSPFLNENLRLLIGYRRQQGIVFRPGDIRFTGRDAADAILFALNDPHCTMVNRNAGSGTRILIDQQLAEFMKSGQQPPGYAVHAKSHNAVAAAVAQGRADWGVAIDTVAMMYGLAFIPLQAEHYDFAIPAARWDRPAVKQFRDLLDDATIRTRLQQLGFRL
ncbi:MAG: molybdopterin biosynthesis protein [Planctomycetes bacterium]|nr:molybdopterin biosynthesis protein [Planctomycetota bacterium]